MEAAAVVALADVEEDVEVVVLEVVEEEVAVAILVVPLEVEDVEDDSVDDEAAEVEAEVAELVVEALFTTCIVTNVLVVEAGTVTEAEVLSITILLTEFPPTVTCTVLPVKLPNSHFPIKLVKGYTANSHLVLFAKIGVNCPEKVPEAWKLFT